MSLDTKAKYLAFSPDTKHEVAIQAFVKRFGMEPETVIQTAGALNVGPIPQKQEGQLSFFGVEK
mgnify:CR=1 FL=1